MTVVAGILIFIGILLLIGIFLFGALYEPKTREE